MTGQDILRAEFEKAGMRGGYKADQVDEFLSSVAKVVDDLENEKSELEYKIKILAEKIEQYKREEDNMKDALIGAQTHGKRVIEEAQQKAEEMIKQTEHACEKSLNEAKKKSDLLTTNSLDKAKSELSEIQRETKREEQLLQKLKGETSNFRKSILDQYKAHIAAVQNLPSLVDQSLGNPTNNNNSHAENRAKHILRDEENKVAKERSVEPKPDPKKVEQRIPKQQVPKEKPVKVDDMLEEESKLSKSKTLEFDNNNLNISSIPQPSQQTQTIKPVKTKQEPEKTLVNSPKPNHVQTERPDYLKKFGELEFGKNKGN